MNAMTAQDLIDWLSDLPEPDKTHIGIVYSCCSQYVLLEKDDLGFVPAPDAIRRSYRHEGQYVLRNGIVMEYDKKTWPPEEEPVFISMVTFPGN